MTPLGRDERRRRTLAFISEHYQLHLSHWTDPPPYYALAVSTFGHAGEMAQCQHKEPGAMAPTAWLALTRTRRVHRPNDILSLGYPPRRDLIADRDEASLGLLAPLNLGLTGPDLIPLWL